MYTCVYIWQYAFNARLGLVGKWTNGRWVSEFTFEAQLRLLAEPLQEMAAILSHTSAASNRVIEQQRDVFRVIPRPADVQDTSSAQARPILDRFCQAWRLAGVVSSTSLGYDAGSPWHVL